MQVLREQDRAYMFYTGLTRDPSFYQSIGLAICDNLKGMRWERYQDAPILTADPRWYQTEGKMAWRDPFVIRDEAAGLWRMFLAGKQKDLPEERNGCIVTATSEDLLHWEVHPPLIAPGRYSEMECPVYHRHGGKYHLLVSISDDRSIHQYSAKQLNGPWTDHGPIAPESCYAPRLIHDHDGRPALMHTVPQRYGGTNDGPLVRGFIAEPKEVRWEGERMELRWYEALDRHLESTDRFEEDRFVLVVRPEAESYRVVLRDDDEQKHLVIERQDNRLRIRNPCTGQLHYETSLPAESLPLIRLLRWEEYIEVYVDGRFVELALDYDLPSSLQLMHTGCAELTMYRIDL
jgi:hypothetical protein